MKKITDPSFKYVPAADTDIRKTFARLKRQAKKKATPAAENVRALEQPKKKGLAGK